MSSYRYTLYGFLFTFHNVSINSYTAGSNPKGERYLHSTMFLLIHTSNGLPDKVWNTFTFHNVSINSEFPFTQFAPMWDLHSTMFLLILLPSPCIRIRQPIYIPQCFY